MKDFFLLNINVTLSHSHTTSFDILAPSWILNWHGTVPEVIFTVKDLILVQF